MTRSAVRLARVALAVGEEALPRYAARTSRHDYTRAQVFALPVLKESLRTDYRGVVALAAEWGELRRALRLAHVPHYSTLCYAARRLAAAAFDTLQAACVRRARAAGLTAPGRVVTADATGLERHHARAPGPVLGRHAPRHPARARRAPARAHGRVVRQATPTFSDALAAVRAHWWRWQRFRPSPREVDMVKLPRRVVQRLSEAACYAT